MLLYLYYSGDADWKPVPLDVETVANLQENKLQIKTNSARGSTKLISLYLYRDTGSEGFVSSDLLWIWFKIPISYYMTNCNKMYDPFPREPPNETTKVWGIGKTETGLKIDCNGVTVLHYKTSSCEDSERWGLEIKKIQFLASDSASEQYRLVQGKCILDMLLQFDTNNYLLYYR